MINVRSPAPISRRIKMRYVLIINIVVCALRICRKSSDNDIYTRRILRCKYMSAVLVPLSISHVTRRDSHRHSYSCCVVLAVVIPGDAIGLYLRNVSFLSRGYPSIMEHAHITVMLGCVTHLYLMCVWRALLALTCIKCECMWLRSKKIMW